MNVAMSYSYIDLRVTSTTSLKLAGQDVNRTWMDADTAPRHQVSARSTVELPYKIRCTLWLRYVDELRGPGAPEYVTMDAVIAWKSLPNLELSLAGQNLIEPKHFEYGVDATGNQTAPIARSVYGKVAWTF
jgi:iron complex outermembrane receptor protein